MSIPVRIVPAAGLLLAAASCHPGLPAPVRPGPRFRAVTAGADHTCALAVNGTAYCWGSNAAGELGTGDEHTRTVPTPVADSVRFSQLSAGDALTCGVSTQGVAYCWGRNRRGQLGNGLAAVSDLPVPVTGGLLFRQVSAGSNYVCGVAADAAAYCWGDNVDGQLGTGDTTPQSSRPLPVTGGHRFTAVSAGWSHTCAVATDGRAFCWGDNAAGQLGDGTRDPSRRPVEVAHVRDFVAVTVGAEHSCGLTRAGVAYCWGDGFQGQVRGRPSSWVPVAQYARQALAAITAGAYHTCGLTIRSVRRLNCWGSNLFDQLGRTDPGAAPSSDIYAGIRFVQVDAGFAHSCGVTEAGGIYCWGRNADGQLGDGSRVTPVRPTPVATPDSSVT